MSTPNRADLKGLKVLIVEDGVFTALALQELLTEAGCEVIGPCPRLDEAMEVARTAILDVAVLDIDIDGANAFGVADELQERGIPFIFASGYGHSRTPARLAAAIALEKPFDNAALLEALQATLHRTIGGSRCSAQAPAPE
jgi:DNA-binding response OmpR family regulator